jgi:hypothetical protein
MVKPHLPAELIGIRIRARPLLGVLAHAVHNRQEGIIMIAAHGQEALCAREGYHTRRLGTLVDKVACQEGGGGRITGGGCAYGGMGEEHVRGVTTQEQPRLWL